MCFTILWDAKNQSVGTYQKKKCCSIHRNYTSVEKKHFLAWPLKISACSLSSYYSVKISRTACLLKHMTLAFEGKCNVPIFISFMYINQVFPVSYSKFPSSAMLVCIDLGNYLQRNFLLLTSSQCLKKIKHVLGPLY